MTRGTRKSFDRKAEEEGGASVSVSPAELAGDEPTTATQQQSDWAAESVTSTTNDSVIFTPDGSTPEETTPKPAFAQPFRPAVPMDSVIEGLSSLGLEERNKQEQQSQKPQEPRQQTDAEKLALAKKREKKRLRNQAKRQRATQRKEEERKQLEEQKQKQLEEQKQKQLEEQKPKQLEEQKEKQAKKKKPKTKKRSNETKPQPSSIPEEKPSTVVARDKVIELFDDYFGTRNLANWQRLCIDLGVDEREVGTVTRCKKALETINVNIYDFLAAIEERKALPKEEQKSPLNIKHFDSVNELFNYSEKHSRIFPKSAAKTYKGSPLRALLRDFFGPRGAGGYRRRKKNSGGGGALPEGGVMI